MTYIADQSILKFSHDYWKLNHPIFFTLRKNRTCSIGQVVEVRSPTKNFDAFCIGKYRIALKNIPTPMLLYDTRPFCKKYQEVLPFLSKFYKNPLTWDNVFNILFFQKEEL